MSRATMLVEDASIGSRPHRRLYGDFSPRYVESAPDRSDYVAYPLYPLQPSGDVNIR